MKFRDIKLSKQSKALLTILIKEIKDIINSHPYDSGMCQIEINELLDSWINANNLKLYEVVKEDGIYQLKL